MNLFDKKFVHFMWDDSLDGKEGFVSDSIDTLVTRVNDDILMTVDGQNIFGLVSYGSGALPFSIDRIHYRFFYRDPNYSCKRANMEGKQIQYRNKNSSDQWKDCSEEPYWAEQCEYRVKPEPEMWTACIDDKGIVSVMPACEWNKDAGRQLIEGTEEKCEVFAVENYCNKCAYHAACVGHKCIMNLDMWYCQGFRELNAVKKRRRTNRELSKWLADNNGQVMYTSSKFKCTEHSYTTDDNAPVSSNVLIRGWDETEWSEPLIEE